MKKKFISTIIISIILFQIICPILAINEIYADNEVILTIPDSMAEIKGSQYAEDGITELNFDEPSSLKKIGKSAFLRNNIKSLKIPDSVEEIGGQAFGDNPITELKLGKSLKKIGSGAFGGTDLNEVDIPDSVQVIEEQAFSSEKTLTSTYNKTNIISKIQLGDSLKNIGNKAFYMHICEEIEIPESVEYIGRSAFQRNESAKGKKYNVFVYSKNVRYADAGTYDDIFCNERIEAEKNDLTLYGYKDSTTETYANEHGIKFKTFDEEKIVYEYYESFELAKVKKVNDSAIDENGKLVFPETVEKDGKEYKVYAIGSNAVKQDNITEIVLPENMTRIEDNAFENYRGSVKIPKNVSYLDINAFATHDIEISIDEDNPYYKMQGYLCDKDIKKIYGDIYKPYVTVDSNVWESVTEIGEKAFKYSYKMTGINIGPNVTKIAENAFEGIENQLTIRGYKGSYVEQYAKAHNINFEMVGYIDEEGNKIPVVKQDGIYYGIYENDSSAVVLEVTEDAIGDRGKLEIPPRATYMDVEYAVEKIISHAVDIDGIYKLDLPFTLKEIEEEAFTKYAGNVEIPERVSLLSINSFSSHGIVMSIDENNSYYSVEGNNLFDKQKTIFYGVYREFGLENIWLPETVVEIAPKAYKYARTIDEIKHITIIEEKIEKIAEDAFEGVESKFIIQGYTDSFAEEYAKKHNIEFESIGNMPFIWHKDNYNFANAAGFDSYDIGEFKNYLSNSLKRVVEKLEDKEVTGECAGMSLTEIMFKKGLLTPDYWQVDNAEETKEKLCPYTLEKAYNNVKLKNLINFYQIFQTEIENKGLTPLDSQRNMEVDDFFNTIFAFYNFKNKNELLFASIKVKNFGGTSGYHAVVVLDGPENTEEIEDYDNENNYKYRIPIYDCNINARSYIYVSEDLKEASLYNYEDVKLCYASKMDLDNVFNLEEIAKNGGKYELGFLKTIQYNMEKGIKITNEKGEYAEIEDGEINDGTLNCEVRPIIDMNIMQDGNYKQLGDIIFEDGEYYEVETKNETDELDIQMQFGDSFMVAKTKAGGKAIFENKKSVTLTNPSGQEYEIEITLNDEFMKLPWYTINVAGKDAKEIKLEMTEEGALVTGDNLQNLIVKGNNDAEQVQLNLSTDKTQVLIKASEDKTKMLAYIDTDGDGIFETLIGEAKSEPIPEKNDQEETSKVKTGDKIKYFAIAFGLALVIFIVIEIIKHLKK